MGVCVTVSVWTLIVLSAHCFDRFSTPAEQHNWNQPLNQVELKHEEQNEPGLIIETKLKLAKTLRDNVVTLIGKLLFEQSGIQFTQPEIDAFLQLHQIIQTRTIPSTNLLPLIKNIDGNVLLVFRHLEQILPLSQKSLAEIALAAINRGNITKFDILKNIPMNSTRFAEPISEEELDSLDTILVEIPFLIGKNAILSTSQLIAGLLVNVPVSVITHEYIYAEKLIYDYLITFTEGVKSTNSNLGNSKELVTYVLQNLNQIPDLSKRIINMGKTLIPFLSLPPIPVIRTCSNKRTCIENMQSILANNSLKLDHLLSIMNSEHFPKDIMANKRQIISLQKVNLFNAPKMFKDLNVFEYRTQTELILAVLNHLQNMMIPHNVIDMVKAIYIHAKIAFEHANNIPRFLSSDMQVEQLLNAFINQKNQILIKSINTIKSTLLDKNFNWPSLKFNYQKCKEARKCLSYFLVKVTQNPYLKTRTISEAIKMYFTEVNVLNQQLTHPLNARPNFVHQNQLVVPQRPFKKIQYPQKVTNLFNTSPPNYFQNPSVQPKFVKYPQASLQRIQPNRCEPKEIVYFRCCRIPWSFTKNLPAVPTFVPPQFRPQVVLNAPVRRFSDKSNVDLMAIYYNH